MSSTGSVLTPLPTPANPAVSADTVMSGKHRPAIEVIRLFSADEWETFIQEWANGLKTKYTAVGRMGGAGDMGRDICAFYNPSTSGTEWDNYQCKHYDNPLSPTDVWVELGKLCYYTFIGEYSAPKSYFFVAPRGCGAKLSTLMQQPTKLRDALIANWQKFCQTQIRTIATPLDSSLLAHIRAFDFSIVKPLSILTVIEEHKDTCWHVARFGGGLPERPDPPLPPASIDTQKETRYVEQLLGAYGDHVKATIANAIALSHYAVLQEHFQRSREQFYYAEALRTFSRDTLPPGQFERLQKEVLDGILDIVTDTHTDGFARVKATINQARLLPLHSHALSSRIFMNDRCGICHQLANENKVLWLP